MPKFVCTSILVTKETPFFIGYLEKFIETTDNIVSVPMTAEDVDTIKMSLSRREQVYRGLVTREYENIPVEGFQDVIIDKSAIIEPRRFQDSFYEVFGESPFDVNFKYIPPIEPYMFLEPGVYVVRFEFVSTQGHVMPFEDYITVE